MKDNSRKRAPTLRLVKDGHVQSKPDDVGHMTFELEIWLRDAVKHIAHLQHTTVRRVMTKAVKKLVTDFKASAATGQDVDRDD